MYLLHMFSKLFCILELLITLQIFTFKYVRTIMLVELMLSHKVIIFKFSVAIAALYPLVRIII